MAVPNIVWHFLVTSAMLGLVGGECACDSVSNKTSYVCHGCDAVPVQSFTPQVKRLHLSQNKITSVPRLNFSELTFVDLSDNVITSIENGAFTVCNQMITLNLTENRLNNLTSDMFIGLKNLEHLHLGNNRLTGLYEQDLFREHTRNLQILNLTNNNIHDMHHLSLADLDELLMLDLSSNELEFHHPLHFKGLNKLNNLFLQNNNIARLNKSVYSDLTALDMLNLNHNVISDIEDGAFKGLHNLMALHLSYNRLTTIHEEFRFLSNLKHLYLNSNPITQINSEVLPNSLQIFSLADCMQLKTLENDTFYGLKQLQYVYIKNNSKLSVIDSGAFDTYGRIINTVDLSNNALVTLSETTLQWSNISNLNLQGNHWDCDCHLAWMLHLSTSLSRQVKCSTPDQFRGTSIADLTFDSFSCSVFVRYRRRAAIGLAAAVTVVFVALASYLVYRKRARVMPCWFKKDKQYQTLYNASDPEESAIQVDFENVRDRRKMSSDPDTPPEPTAV